MKKIILSAFLATGMLAAVAQETQLVVEQIDNHGLVQGNTYRVYVQAINGNSVHAVFGAEGMPAHIETTTTFYQSQIAGATAEHLNEGIIQADPASEYDSFVTIGETDNTLDGLWNVGTDYTNFENGGTLDLNEATYFVVPQNEASRSENGLVLIAQLTTDGTASGLLHIQGWDEDEVTYQALNLPFTTNNAYVFGCTDANSDNYNPNATYDDGSCDGVISVDEISAVNGEDWSIFPNPIFGGAINVQFAKGFLVNGEQINIDIFDTAGKRVASQTLNASDAQGGNKIHFNQQLAPGMYTLQIMHAGKKHANQLLMN